MGRSCVRMASLRAASIARRGVLDEDSPHSRRLCTTRGFPASVRRLRENVAMEETTLEPGTGTGVIAEEDTRTGYRIDEGDQDRFAPYVDKCKLTAAYGGGAAVRAVVRQGWARRSH